MFTSIFTRCAQQATRPLTMTTMSSFRGFATRRPPGLPKASPTELVQRWETRYSKITQRIQIIDERLEKLAVYKPRTEKTVKAAQERVEKYSTLKEKLLESQKRALTLLTRHQKRINRDSIRDSLPERAELVKLPTEQRLDLLARDPSLRSGYTLFSRDYALQNPGSRLGDFTSGWRALPQAEKAKYQDAIKKYAPQKVA